MLRDLKYNYIAFVLSLVALYFIKYQSSGVEGGMDSWSHFLISKYAPRHPELFLDQWNKPVFTVLTTLFCQNTIDSLITFNIYCVLIGALLISLSVHYKGFRNSWVLIPFIVFMPELFLNTVSGLTEPLSLLLVAVFIWLWTSGNYRSAMILAGFLPFVRTEGFVIDGAILIWAVYDKRYKAMPWILLGLVFMDLLGYAITGHPFWIVTDNPYWRFEMDGAFDPGSGDLMHFIHLSRSMFGLVLIVLAILGLLTIVVQLFRKDKPNSLFVFAALAFVFYFSAHTLIYYFGILGSHGLTRPMALLAPFVGLIAFYPIDFFLKKAGHVWRMSVFTLIALSVIWVGYAETKFPKPHRYDQVAIPFDRTQIGFVKAGNWLRDNGLLDRVIVHQSPFFNCIFDKDPYDPKSSYYIWSIDQANDWSEDGTIVIWDGWSAKREGNMPLEWLQKNPRFKELLYIKGENPPADDPERFDIYIFEKIPLGSETE